jgi:class 3 adenylate cyclase
VIDGAPIQMFVMAADIRESTALMKEAIAFEKFASVMDRFVSSVRLGIRRSGGWFDKFTGDGFLAYWIVQGGSPTEYEERFVQTAGDITHTAHTLIDLFHRRVMEDFRANSRNLSSGVGSRWAWTPAPATWSRSPTSSPWSARRWSGPSGW